MALAKVVWVRGGGRFGFWCWLRSLIQVSKPSLNRPELRGDRAEQRYGDHEGSR